MHARTFHTTKEGRKGERQMPRATQEEVGAYGPRHGGGEAPELLQLSGYSPGDSHRVCIPADVPE